MRKPLQLDSTPRCKLTCPIGPGISHWLTVGESAHQLTMKFNWKGTIMKNILNHSKNLAAWSRAGCLPGLLLLAVLLVIVTPVRAEKPPTYLFEIDSNAVPGGFQPIAVALDSSNNLYVADEYNDRVEKFTGNENYLTQWGGSGIGNGNFENVGLHRDRRSASSSANHLQARVRGLVVPCSASIFSIRSAGCVGMRGSSTDRRFARPPEEALPPAFL